MPYRRRRPSYRRSNRYRRYSRRRTSQYSRLRRMSRFAFVPASSRFLKLRYTDYQMFTPADHYLSSHAYAPQTPFDIDRTSSGEQPYGYDQLQAAYKNVQTYAFQVTLTIIPGTVRVPYGDQYDITAADGTTVTGKQYIPAGGYATGPFYYGYSVDDSSGTSGIPTGLTSAFLQYPQIAHGKQRFYPGGETDRPSRIVGPIQKMDKYIDAGHWNDTEHTFPTDSAPTNTQQVWLNTYVASPPLAALSVRAVVRMDLTVWYRFVDAIDVAPST